MNLTPRATEKEPGSAGRLGLWAVAIVALIFAFIPVLFNPNAVMLYVAAAFYLIKFKYLMYLSAALLVAVLGATLLGARFIMVPVSLPVFAFLGASTLSTLLSGNITQSLIGNTNRHDGLLSLAAGTLLFYGTARFVDSWAKVRVILVAGITSALVISLYGLTQKLGLDPVPGWDIPWYDGTLRAFSTLGNPLHLAAYLTLAMGTIMALYFLTEARWERTLWLAVLALIGACWLYAEARGAMLGAIVSLPVLLWLSHRKMGTVRPLLVPLGVLLAATLVATTMVAANPGSSGAERTSQEKSLSVLIRLQIWRDTVPVILERPLLGHGPDNFAAPFERYEGEDLKNALYNPATGKPDTVDKAHNEFLQVTATTGLLGLAAYLWIFVSYFRNAYRSGGWPIIAFSGAVLAYVLQLQTAFTTIATGVTFWAVLGVSVAVMRLREKEGAKENQEPRAPEGIEATLGARA